MLLPGESTKNSVACMRLRSLKYEAGGNYVIVTIALFIKSSLPLLREDGIPVSKNGFAIYKLKNEGMYILNKFKHRKLLSNSS